MKLSKVLLTAMLTYSYSSVAQEFGTNKDLDSVRTQETTVTSNEKPVDSLFLAKMERYYAKRNRRLKKRTNKRKVTGVHIKSQSKKPKLTYFNCPGCGRG